MRTEKFYELQENVKQTTEDIKFQLDKIVKRPLIKKIFYKMFPKNEIKEFEIAFDYLKTKQFELIKFKEILNKLYDELVNENEELLKRISELEKDKSNIEEITQLKMRYITNMELIKNQIPIVDEMIETFVSKLEKALPHMEATIKKRLMINTTLKSLSLLIDNVIELENYAKELEKQNVSMIEKLVSESTEKIINSIDIEYYKNMNERNKKLQNLYNESKEKYYKKLEELNSELDKIK
jgi:hypothetical protein